MQETDLRPYPVADPTLISASDEPGECIKNHLASAAGLLIGGDCDVHGQIQSYD